MGERWDTGMLELRISARPGEPSVSDEPSGTGAATAFGNNHRHVERQIYQVDDAGDGYLVMHRLCGQHIFACRLTQSRTLCCMARS